MIGRVDPGPYPPGGRARAGRGGARRAVGCPRVRGGRARARSADGALWRGITMAEIRVVHPSEVRSPGWRRREGRHRRLRAVPRIHRAPARGRKGSARCWRVPHQPLNAAVDHDHNDVGGTLRLLNALDAAWEQIDEPKSSYTIAQNSLSSEVDPVGWTISGAEEASTPVACKTARLQRSECWRHDRGDERYD